VPSCCLNRHSVSQSSSSRGCPGITEQIRAQCVAKYVLSKCQLLSLLYLISGHQAFLAILFHSSSLWAFPQDRPGCNLDFIGGSLYHRFTGKKVGRKGPLPWGYLTRAFEGSEHLPWCGKILLCFCVTLDWVYKHADRQSISSVRIMWELEDN
jgi:hypothetical protein